MTSLARLRSETSLRLQPNNLFSFFVAPRRSVDVSSDIITIS